MGRRKFIILLAAAATLGFTDRPALSPMPVRGAPKRLNPWGERHFDVASEPRRIPWNLRVWDRLAADRGRAPLLPYGPSDCVDRTIAVRAFLSIHWPLGALRPTLGYRDGVRHMGLTICTHAGDLYWDSIGNILGPWEMFPANEWRYHSGNIWEHLDADLGGKTESSGGTTSG